MAGASTFLNTAVPLISATSATSVAVVQDGARLHYALPLALQGAGILGRVFTEWFVTPGSLESLMLRAVKWLSPDLGRRMSERKCPALNVSAVRRNPWLVLKQQWGRGQFRTEGEYFKSSRHTV